MNMTVEQIDRLYERVYNRCCDAEGKVYGLDGRTIGAGWKVAFKRVGDEMLKANIITTDEYDLICK